MVRPFIFPALTIWGTRGTLVLCLSERQPFFAALTQRGELRSAERGDSPRPAAGQEGRHQGFYPLNSHFLWGRVWRRLPTCDRCEKEYGRGFFLP